MNALVSKLEPATVRRLRDHERRLPADRLSSSSHGFVLAHTNELSRAMGRLPREPVIVTIEAADVGCGTELTPAVAAPAEGWSKSSQRSLPAEQERFDEPA